MSGVPTRVDFLFFSSLLFHRFSPTSKVQNFHKLTTGQHSFGYTGCSSHQVIPKVCVSPSPFLCCCSYHLFSSSASLLLPQASPPRLTLSSRHLHAPPGPVGMCCASALNRRTRAEDISSPLFLASCEDTTPRASTPAVPPAPQPQPTSKWHFRLPTGMPLTTHPTCLA